MKNIICCNAFKVISNLNHKEVYALANKLPFPHPEDVDLSVMTEEKRNHVLAVREARLKVDSLPIYSNKEETFPEKKRTG